MLQTNTLPTELCWVGSDSESFTTYNFLFQIWQEQELPERREDPGGGEKEWSSSSHRLPGINSLVLFKMKRLSFN